MSLQDGFSIPVVLIPVHCPPLLLSQYVNALNGFTSISMDNLTPPGDYSRERSAFTYQSWTDGCLFLRFQLGPMLPHQTSHYQHWSTFSASEDVAVVIGLWHCPSAPDMALAYETFRARAAPFASSPVIRCFGFECSVDHLQHEALGSMPLLHLLFTGDAGVPPVPGGRVSDHTERLLQLQLCRVCEEVLQAYERAVLELKATEGSRLVTHLDSGPVSPSFKGKDKKSTKNKKRWLGRMEKRMGDVSLLAGAPADALQHYEEALSLCMSGNDLLWAGGAAEGYASAVLAYSATRLSTPPNELCVRESVVGRCEEAIRLYDAGGVTARGTALRIKLARYLMDSPLMPPLPPSSSSKKPAKPKPVGAGSGSASGGGSGVVADDTDILRLHRHDAVFKAATHLTAAAHAPDCDVTQRVWSLVSCVDLCLSAGRSLRRKAVLFLHELTELLLALGFRQAASYLLCHTATLQGLSPSPSHALTSFSRRSRLSVPYTTPVEADVASGGPDGPPMWPSHHAALHALLLDVANSEGDSLVTVTQLLALLKDVEQVCRSARDPTMASTPSGLPYPCYDASVPSTTSSSTTSTPVPPPALPPSVSTAGLAPPTSVRPPLARKQGLCERMGLPPFVALGVSDALLSLSSDARLNDTRAPLAFNPDRLLHLPSVESSDALSTAVRRVVGHPVVVSTTGQTVSDDDALWWLTVHGLDREAEENGGVARDEGSDSDTGGGVISVAVCGDGEEGEEETKSESILAVHTDPSLTHVLSTDVSSPLAGLSPASSAPPSPPTPATPSGGLKLEPHSVSKVLWSMLKRVVKPMPVRDRHSVDMTGVPVPVYLLPLPLCPSAVPSVRRIRLRLRPDSTDDDDGGGGSRGASVGGGGGSVFIFDPFKKKGKDKDKVRVPGHRKKEVPSQLSWVAGNKAKFELCLENPLAVSFRMGVSVVCRYSHVGDVDGGGVPTPLPHPPLDASSDALLRRVDDMDTPVAAQLASGAFLSDEVLVRLTHSPEAQQVLIAITLPSFPTDPRDGVSDLQLLTTHLYIRMGGLRWLHALAPTVNPVTVSVHPQVPRAVLDRRRLSFPPLVSAIPALPEPASDDAVTAGQSSQTVQLFEGQTAFVPLWVTNSSTDHGARWMSVSATVSTPARTPTHASTVLSPSSSVASVTGLTSPTSVGAFRPKIVLFNSDPVPEGEEGHPPPACPFPYHSPPYALLNTARDDQSGVEVRAVSVDNTEGGEVVDKEEGGKEETKTDTHTTSSPADTADDGYVISPGATTRAVVAVSCDNRETTVGRVYSSFTLEWLYSRDVYSPYVMKMEHSLRVEVLPGPVIVSMSAAAWVPTVSDVASDSSVQQCTVVATVRNVTEHGLRLHPSDAQCRLTGCACGPIDATAPAAGCGFCTVPASDVREITLCVERDSEGQGQGQGQGMDRAVQRARQRLKLVWQLDTGCVGSVCPPTALLKPPVVAPMMSSPLTAVLQLIPRSARRSSFDGVQDDATSPAGVFACRVVPGTWLALSLILSVSTGRRTADADADPFSPVMASCVNLCVVPLRDLRAYWCASVDGLATTGLDGFSQFVVSGWIQSDGIELGDPTLPDSRQFRLCPLATGDYALFIEYRCGQSAYTSRSNVVVVNVVREA